MVKKTVPESVTKSKLTEIKIGQIYGELLPEGLNVTKLYERINEHIYTTASTSQLYYENVCIRG